MDDTRLCPVCGEENPQRAKFCLECGTRFPAEIAEALPQMDIVAALPQEASGGERRIVTVLFADLSGFTSFSEQTDVEEVRAIADETADRLGEIVVRYGGTVDKIIGDCVMAVWGAPSSHEDDPERAVRAALDMQAHTKEHAERFAGLGLSVGLNTGEAIWAPVGGSYTVLGDTVNTAARLQGAAPKGEIFVGSETFENTQEAIEFETLEPIAMKNKREPVPAFRALGVQGEAQRRRTTKIPLVGRDAELGRLTELWERVRTEAAPYSALLLGAPGVGKSRLVEALTKDIGNAATVLAGRCLPYGDGITYWPVIQIIKQGAGILYDDDHAEVSQKLGAFLEMLGSEDLDELRTMAVAVANLVGEPTTPRGTYTATEISRGELHWGLRRIIELMSASRPVVLVLEDLHWAEPALLELITYLFEPRTQAPLLGIGGARPELAEAHPDHLTGRENLRVIEVDPLPEEASVEMIRRLVGGEGDLSEPTLRKLLDASGGNPLFLEEIIQTWVDAGAAVDELEGMDVPTGLQALISSRLDRLPPHELRLLSNAAVMGDVFWSGALVALGLGDVEIERIVDALVERDLVRVNRSTSLTGQREFAFKHGLIRDVAYARLPKRERATLHEDAGNWVRTIDEDEFAEIVAYHLEQACKLAGEVSRTAHPPPVLAAVQALKRAAEKAEGRDGIAEAARFYDRAMGIVGTQYPETLVDLRLHRAQAELGIGQLERAYADMEEVAASAESVSRTDLRSRALINLVELGLALGHVAEAREHLVQAEEAASRAADAQQRIRVALVRSRLHGSVDGSIEAAERDLMEAVELSEEIGDQRFLVPALLRLGVLAYNSGKLAAAAEAFQRVREVARERGSLQNEATATGFLAAVLYHVGPRTEAQQLAAQAADWLDRLADRHLQGQAVLLLGKLALDHDSPAEAQSLFANALEIFPAHRLLLATINRFIAEARARQGRPIGARSAAAAAVEAASDEEPYAQAFAAVAEGCAATAEGADEAAREAFARGLALFDQQGMVTDLAEARVTYARALTRFGDAAAATEQLGLARAALDEMGSAASVALIDELVRRTDEGADLFGPLA